LESHSFQFEYGNPDDEYGCLQIHDLHLENDASPDDNFVDDATLPIIKTDDNYSAMVIAAEYLSIIEKTAWGNESLLDYFLREIQNKCTGIQSVVSNATKHYKLTSRDIDYHMLGTLLCNNPAHEKIRLLELFLNETLLAKEAINSISLCYKEMLYQRNKVNLHEYANSSCNCWW
jgi:hypothetical protein